MGQKINLSWDGEKVKQVVQVDDMKLTPKQIIDSLDTVRSQINQMKQQKDEINAQIVQIDNNIKSAEEFEKERGEFEERCLEIQMEKLKLYISQIHEECKAKAQKDADEIIAKDPVAYTDAQKKQMPYLNYQKLIATNEKIAENISKRVITEKLFDEPIFSNPFE